MRGLVLALAAPLVVAGLASCGDETDAVAVVQLPPRQCRHAWADLYSLHGENGNPDGIQVLVDRWDAYLEEAHQNTEHLPPAHECAGRLKEVRADWDGLERLMYALDEDVPMLVLERAERDRAHYEERQPELGNSGDLSPSIDRAFVDLRREAPLADADLASVFADAGDVDVSDPSERRAYLRRVRDAGEQSPHVQAFRVAVHGVYDDMDYWEE